MTVVRRMVPLLLAVELIWLDDVVDSTCKIAHTHAFQFWQVVAHVDKRFFHAFHFHLYHHIDLKSRGDEIERLT